MDLGLWRYSAPSNNGMGASNGDLGSVLWVCQEEEIRASSFVFSTDYKSLFHLKVQRMQAGFIVTIKRYICLMDG